MSKIVDARGLDCPQPVILTKKVMDQGETENITTIVNTAIALENVSKLANSQGYDIEVEEKEGAYYIHMQKVEQLSSIDGQKDGDTAILITSRLFGQGDEELGQILMKSFMYSLTEVEHIKAIIFMNSGVFLTCEGSPVVGHLKALQDQGAEVLSCGTCLDYYNLKEKLAVGKVTNMYSAVETLNKAFRTITL